MMDREMVEKLKAARGLWEERKGPAGGMPRKTLVIANSYADFRRWCVYHRIHPSLPNHDAPRYVTGIQDLRGAEEYDLVLLNVWGATSMVTADLVEVALHRAKNVYREHIHIPIVERGAVVGWRTSQESKS